MSPVSIAIIGLNGSLGQPTLEAINSGKFDSKIQYPIKALTRKAQTSTDKIQYIQTEITSETVDSIAKQLAGVDVIIELVSHNPDLLNTLEQVVVQVKPKLFIPSQFGCEISVMDKFIPGFLGFKDAHSKNVRKAGIKTVDIITNYFAEPKKFLYEVVNHAGIDPSTQSILQIGELTNKVSFTRVEDIGNVIVAVATTNPNDLPDQIRVKSGSVSYQDIIDRYEQTHDVKLTVKDKITVEEAEQQLKDKIAEGGFNPADFLWYLHVVGANGAIYYEGDNELINPNQSIWKWTAY
ncbi:hypothetical protein JA1_003507 [Spathaspora sp. JA1]|nr:hypothetical protein JA1_003507 [Spathaspora sp. JA1]